MVISTFEFNKSQCNFDTVHKDVLALFGCNRAYQNVLYMAIDNRLIVQSDIMPQRPSSTLRLMNTKNCDQCLTNIKSGDIVKLFAVYEPTKKQARKDRNSTNISLKNESERKDWVKRKWLTAGSIIAVNEVSKRKVTVHKHDDTYHELFLYSYEFLLQAKDANEFRKLIKAGIGRSKSYGAGLSLVMGVQRVQ